MLTYPRFARACYAFFAVAVLAAVLKLGVSFAEPALLKMLPATPTASAVEPARATPDGPEDPRLEGFSGDGGAAERLETALSRTASREGSLEDPDDASVFRRPSLERGSASEPVCGDLGDAPESSRVVFPLPEAYFNSYDDTWGAARPQGGHEGSDLMSPAGTPEFAVTDGRLVAVAASNDNGWNRLGGYTVMLEAAYDVGPIKKGDLFYYAHLDRESSLPVGTEVRAGQRIGTVGDTGEGPEVTRGKFPPHLHLGWYDADLSRERSGVESGAMNPYPLLVWLESNGGAVSGGTDASYCEAPQSRIPTPSTGEPDWPIPSAPGQRPDLDTGGDSASPAVSSASRDDEPRKNRPERDGAKDRNDARGQKAENKGNDPDRARDKAAELPLRKKLDEKMDALLRDLPSLDFDRTIPEDGDEGRQQDKKRGDGRKDGDAGENREEDRPRPEHPPEDRPDGNEAVPPKETPKAPIPVETVPDREHPPVPEETGNPPEVTDKPKSATPPKLDRESPPEETEPLPDATTDGPIEDDSPLEEAPVPVAEDVPPATEEEAEPTIEPDEAEQQPPEGGASS